MCRSRPRKDKTTVTDYDELVKKETEVLALVRSASASFVPIELVHDIIEGASVLHGGPVRCRIAKVARNILARYLVGWRSTGASATK
jgi:hypothetical protein